MLSMARYAASAMSLDASFSELFGPQRRHPYFEGAGDRPFRSHSLDFEPINVWWLAEASLLTYVPEERFVRDALARAGFEDPVLFDEGGTGGVFAVANDFAILAFRGTDPRKFEDWKTDFDARPKATVGRGRVHRGFKDAHDRAADRIGELLAGRTVPVWVTGHSLGGAVATLAAARHDGIHALVTFGAPRVGDRAFRDTCPVPAWRVVHRSDVVARVPPAGIYRHVGRRVYIDREGRYRHESDRWERFVDSVTGQIASGPESLDALLDHSPLRYALHAANAVRVSGPE
jgi:pimeloyl-ACP methyl ester carboxylesterase